ncbi:hypothetical protein D3C75_1326110 [compost metagenome]
MVSALLRLIIERMQFDLVHARRDTRFLNETIQMLRQEVAYPYRADQSLLLGIDECLPGLHI